MANKVKLTPEEIRARRNEASKRWYAAHKAKGAVNKAGKKTAKKADLPAAKKVALVKKDDGAPIMKRVDKLVKKNIKAVGQIKGLMKEVAEILGDTYKTGDEKLIASVQKALGKNLCIQVDAQTLEPEGKAKKVVSFAVGAKLFRVPKRRGTLDGVGTDQVDDIVAACEKTAEQGPGVSDVQSKEISVDPAKLEGVESGEVTEADIDPVTGEETGGEDEDDQDAEEEEEEDDVDEDELSDEEREERRQRRAEKDAEDFQEDYLSGRSDMMRELGAQGFGEED